MQILKKPDQKAYPRALHLGNAGVITLLKNKGLTGRGGAGFSTAMKWEMALNTPADERYIICNADEGEPGTFKDKFIIENNPDLLIEGILIAAYAIEAKKAFIYLRGEYDYLQKILKRSISHVKKKTGAKTDIKIILGAGAYVCGDETAIIQSIEGYRGNPQLKPPFPTARGLFGKPTVINNVETLANVPLAIMFNTWNSSLRLYSVSGNVSRPGVYEFQIGTDLSKILAAAEPKNRIKAVYFGCFGGCMPYEDMPVTSENICGKECMLGACTIIAVDDKHSIVDLATNIAKFYEFESCGKCTPCREGTMRILGLLENISVGKGKKHDLETLQELAEVIKETSFCGLGQTATQHILTALKHFRKEFEERVK